MRTHVFYALVLVFLSVGTVSAMSENLLSNGDFTDGLNHWRLSPQTDADQILVTDNDATTLILQGYAFVLQDVDLQPGKTYKLTATVVGTGEQNPGTQDGKSATKPMMMIQDSDSWEAVAYKQITSYNAKDYTISFTVPENSNRDYHVSLASETESQGHSDHLSFFDDVTLVAVVDDTLPRIHSCSDSEDFGNENIYERTTCTDIWTDSSGDTSVPHPDKCDLDGRRVWQASCRQDVCEAIASPCPNGCSLGACIRTPGDDDSSEDDSSLPDFAVTDVSLDGDIMTLTWTDARDYSDNPVVDILYFHFKESSSRNRPHIERVGPTVILVPSHESIASFGTKSHSYSFNIRDIPFHIVGVIPGAVENYPIDSLLVSPGEYDVFFATLLEGDFNQVVSEYFVYTHNPSSPRVGGGADAVVVPDASVGKTENSEGSSSGTIPAPLSETSERTPLQRIVSFIVVRNFFRNLFSPSEEQVDETPPEDETPGESASDIPPEEVPLEEQYDLVACVSYCNVTLAALYNYQSPYNNAVTHPRLRDVSGDFPGEYALHATNAQWDTTDVSLRDSPSSQRQFSCTWEVTRSVRGSRDENTRTLRFTYPETATGNVSAPTEATFWYDYHQKVPLSIPHTAYAGDDRTYRIGNAPFVRNCTLGFVHDNQGTFHCYDVELYDNAANFSSVDFTEGTFCISPEDFLDQQR